MQNFHNTPECLDPALARITCLARHIEAIALTGDPTGGNVLELVEALAAGQAALLEALAAELEGRG